MDIGQEHRDLLIGALEAELQLSAGAVGLLHDIGHRLITDDEIRRVAAAIAGRGG